MLVVILGNLGSGKTLIMTILNYLDKREIWSNYQIDSNNYREMEVYDLLDLPNNIVMLMDEAHAWIESRASGNELNELLSSILFHSRKTFTDIYLTTPMYSTIDKRFRKMADYIIFCGNRANKDYDDFHFTFYDKHYKSYGKRNLTYLEASRYFYLYNTYEKIISHRKRRLVFKILKKYPTKLKEYINDLSLELYSEYSNGKRITHDSVKNSLLENEIDFDYEKYIYVRLKAMKENDNN